MSVGHGVVVFCNPLVGISQTAPNPFAPICQERSTVEHQALEESWGGLPCKGHPTDTVRPPDVHHHKDNGNGQLLARILNPTTVIMRKTTFLPVKTTIGHIFSSLSLHSNMQRHLFHLFKTGTNLEKRFF